MSSEKCQEIFPKPPRVRQDWQLKARESSTSSQDNATVKCLTELNELKDCRIQALLQEVSELRERTAKLEKEKIGLLGEILPLERKIEGLQQDLEEEYFTSTATVNTGRRNREPSVTTDTQTKTPTAEVTRLKMELRAKGQIIDAWARFGAQWERDKAVFEGCMRDLRDELEVARLPEPISVPIDPTELKTTLPVPPRLKQLFQRNKALNQTPQVSENDAPPISQVPLPHTTAAPNREPGTRAASNHVDVQMDLDETPCVDIDRSSTTPSKASIATAHDSDPEHTLCSDADMGMDVDEVSPVKTVDGALISSAPSVPASIAAAGSLSSSNSPTYSNLIIGVASMDICPSQPKRRGRPKGSKNKIKVDQNLVPAEPKRKRGRPPKTTAPANPSQFLISTDSDGTILFNMKRKRGRPRKYSLPLAPAAPAIAPGADLSNQSQSMSASSSTPVSAPPVTPATTPAPPDPSDSIDMNHEHGRPRKNSLTLANSGFSSTASTNTPDPTPPAEANSASSAIPPTADNSGADIPAAPLVAGAPAASLPVFALSWMTVHQPAVMQTP
ncbi:hypothetical protein HWV62_15317 [Athelia sp. TMB]|nr:hypothetical protein HWV62_15317 [Athelia sp. TMB]